MPAGRTPVFVEESLYLGTQRAVFEPNGKPLWDQIRPTLGAFFPTLFSQDAFERGFPGEAKFVTCDGHKTAQNDMGRDAVDIHVGFPSLEPAEFLIFKIKQMKWLLTEEVPIPLVAPNPQS